mmetsp:Transcript_83856/g.233981  ORF Transcript_83856/g.233981 Transcript_83856/m.233981 type:complete len:381 (+) Transcript_83856:54-1196(+)
MAVGANATSCGIEGCSNQAGSAVAHSAQRNSLDVLYFKTLGPRGETVLDPVLAELLFVAKKEHLQLRLTPCAYPRMSGVGPLPVAVGGALGFVRRSQLHGALAALVGDEKQSADDAAFCSMLVHCVGGAISSILWNDEGMYEDFTRPLILRSAPLGFGWLIAWAEKRRLRVAASGFAVGAAPAAQTVVLMRLEAALSALAERLGSQDVFAAPCGDGDGEDPGTVLDARAYAHLAVLYSIPCERGSPLHQLLRRFPTLSQFCDRTEMQLNAWPDARTFLAALGLDERTPAAAEALGRAAGAAVPAAMKMPRPLAWWELWGWSWGSRRTAFEPRAQRHDPPQWSVPIFASVALVSVALAMSSGWGPLRLDWLRSVQRPPPQA